MTDKQIDAVVSILETTLGGMPAKEADKVVEGVIELLKSFKF